MPAALDLIWREQQHKKCVFFLGGVRSEARVTLVWAAVMCYTPVKILPSKWFQFAQVIKFTPASSCSGKGHLWLAELLTKAGAESR